MEEYERKTLLERVGRESATVGASIPESIDLDGETFALREFVFETRRAEAVTAERREDVEGAKRALRRARRERVDRIEAGEVEYETGERLAEEAVGIDRALNALDALGTETDVESERRQSEAADRKRWRAFLRKALGHDDSRGRGRGRGGRGRS